MGVCVVGESGDGADEVVGSKHIHPIHPFVHFISKTRTGRTLVTTARPPSTLESVKPMGPSWNTTVYSRTTAGTPCEEGGAGGVEARGGGVVVAGAELVVLLLRDAYLRASSCRTSRGAAGAAGGVEERSLEREEPRHRWCCCCCWWWG